MLTFCIANLLPFVCWLFSQSCSTTSAWELVTKKIQVQLMSDKFREFKKFVQKIPKQNGPQTEGWSPLVGRKYSIEFSRFLSERLDDAIHV